MVRWSYNDIEEIGRKDVDWIHVAQDRGMWWILAITVMYVWVPGKAKKFLTGWFMLASEEWLCLNLVLKILL